jgi:hypothetical protein
MPGPDLAFDGCDLASATGDSRGLLVTFLGDLVERAPVASPLRRFIRSATSRSFRPEKLPGCLMIPIG